MKLPDWYSDKKRLARIEEKLTRLSTTNPSTGMTTPSPSANMTPVPTNQKPKRLRVKKHVGRFLKKMGSLLDPQTANLTTPEKPLSNTVLSENSPVEIPLQLFAKKLSRCTSLAEFEDILDLKRKLMMAV